MKVFKSIMNVLAVLAAIGAAFYVGLTYGEKILTWVKQLLKLDMPTGEVCCEGEFAEEACVPAAEETPAEAVEAEEKDFEG